MAVEDVIGSSVILAAVALRVNLGARHRFLDMFGTLPGSAKLLKIAVPTHTRCFEVFVVVTALLADIHVLGSWAASF